MINWKEKKEMYLIDKENCCLYEIKYIHDNFYWIINNKNGTFDYCFHIDNLWLAQYDENFKEQYSGFNLENCEIYNSNDIHHKAILKRRKNMLSEIAKICKKYWLKNNDYYAKISTCF